MVAAIAFAGMTSVASAQTLDPTNLHITSPSQTGGDPVLLNESTTFGVLNNDDGNGKAVIDMTIYIAVPKFSDMTFVAPTVGGLSDNQPGETATGGGLFDFTATNKGGSLFTSGDLNSYVGCTQGCDKSINATNVDAALATIFGQTEVNNNLLGFDVFADAITYAPTNSLGLQDTLTVGITGNLDALPKGSVIFAVGQDAKGNPFVTSWTNTGFVNLLGAPPPDLIPEPGSLVLLGTGLLALGWTRRRLRRA
jgi:hypothetical protein